MDPRAIEKTLCVSTGHLKREDAAILEHLSHSHTKRPRRRLAVIVYDLKYGFLVYVGTDKEIVDEQVVAAYESGLSDDFIELMRLAAKNECAYLHPDADGLELVGVPTFDW